MEDAQREYVIKIIYLDHVSMCGILGKKKASSKRTRESIQNECNNMSQSINSSDRTKGCLFVFKHS